MIKAIDKLPGSKTLTEKIVKRIMQAKKTLNFRPFFGGENYKKRSWLIWILHPDLRAGEKNATLSRHVTHQRCKGLSPARGERGARTSQTQISPAWSGQMVARSQAERRRSRSTRGTLATRLQQSRARPFSLKRKKKGIYAYLVKESKTNRARLAMKKQTGTKHNGWNSLYFSSPGFTKKGAK